MLEGIDPSSPTWRAIEKWAREQRELTRSQLESEGMLHDETTAARGYCRALRAVLHLGAADREER